MLRFAMTLATVILGNSLAFGHTPATVGPHSTTIQESLEAAASLPETAEEDAWAFSAAAFMYVVPDETDYAAATFIADHDWLHLEGRYNYEDIDTGSVFVGFNFSFGEELTLEATPMIGAVSGNTDGIAPGYEITLAYKKFELYTEGEYLFDLDDSSDDFFYSWSEFSYYPADWMRLGLVVQRTKAYESDLDTQAGFLVGFSYEKLDFTTYVFNLWEDPTIVFSCAFNF